MRVQSRWQADWGRYGPVTAYSIIQIMLLKHMADICWDCSACNATFVRLCAVGVYRRNDTLMNVDYAEWPVRFRCMKWWEYVIREVQWQFAVFSLQSFWLITPSMSHNGLLNIMSLRLAPCVLLITIDLRKDSITESSNHSSGLNRR